MREIKRKLKFSHLNSMRFATSPISFLSWLTKTKKFQLTKRELKRKSEKIETININGYVERFYL